MDGQAAKSGLNVVWGARAIANEINQTTRQTFHLLAIGAIKSARRVGGRYCADRNALQREFGATDGEPLRAHSVTTNN